MNIGKKIKDLRNSKLMTQSELAGAEITRNMLSQIENGSALPSVSTMIYLAKKLGVPAGYLLSEGEEEFIYKKTNVMRNIRRAYADRSYDICRDMCLSSFEEYDDEIELILTDCCLGCAEEYMRNGRLHAACGYLDEAVRHSRNTMFITAMQKNSITIMFGLLKEISPSLDSDETDTDISEDLLHPSVYDSIFCKYLTVFLDIEKYKSFLEDIEKSHDIYHDETDELFILHLNARHSMSQGDYKSALATLKRVIDSDTVPQRLLLYLACSDMEICCREVDDYKGAYEFSQNKLEILEHLLADEM